MIPIEKLRAVRTIVAHDNCPDGLASAVLLHDALPDAEMRFAQYGTDDHKGLRGIRGMLFCDFSPHPDMAAEHAAVGTIVLDHHRTAKPIVLAMEENGVYADETAEPGVSGALLAYRHVWLPLRGEVPVEPFAEHFATVAGIRDTWQRKHKLWGEACAQAYLLNTFPRSWWLAQSLKALEAKWEELLVFGAALKTKEEERIQRAIDGGYRFTTDDGRRVLVMQGVSVTSDGAELLGNSVDLVAGFSYGVENDVPKVKFSLRSHTGIDCSSIAKAHGGGGHTAAAGFSTVVQTEDPQPYRLFQFLLDEAHEKLRA